jgi:hypothetical protein
MQELLPLRSYAGIHCKAKKLGLKTKSNFRRREIRKWSQSEIKRLKSLYPYKEKEELIREFNRTWVSIHHKASRLGLSRPYKFVASKLTRGEATDFEIGFITGLLEGEGSITFSGGKNSTPHPMVRISNMNRRLLEKAQKIIGGKIYAEELFPNVYNYDLNIGSLRNVYETLKKLQPYLIGKKRQADLMLEFCQSRLSSVKNKPFTEMEMKIVREIKELNHWRRIQKRIRLQEVMK